MPWVADCDSGPWQFPENGKHETMTTIDLPSTPVPEADVPAFPPEHYGCPTWCTQNVRTEGENYVGHDSADGMPDWPQFRGYRHVAARGVPYAASHYPRRAPNPLSIHLVLEPGAPAPVIAVCNPMDDWADFTIDEAEELAGEITKLVTAYGAPQCPPWCDEQHGDTADRHNHYAMRDVPYASAPQFKNADGVSHANSYTVDLVHNEPQILLGDGHHQNARDITELTIDEAAQAAAVITELVAAARAAQ